MRIPPCYQRRGFLLFTGLIAGAALGTAMRPGASGPVRQAAPVATARSAEFVAPALTAGMAIATQQAVESDGPLKQITAQDFASAIERALLEKNNANHRASVLFELVEALDPAQMPAAIEWAGQFPLRQRQKLLALLTTRWTKIDPQASAPYVLARPKLKEYHEAAITAWALLDADAALAWTLARPSRSERNTLLSAMITSLSDVNPARAFEVLKFQHPDGAFTGEQLEIVFEAWAAKDPSAAMAAAMSCKFKSVRNRAVDAIVSNGAATNGAAAMAWLDQLPNGALKKDAMDTALITWARTQPGEALAYARNLADETQRVEAVGLAMAAWVTVDPAAARVYALALPVGKERSLALTRLPAPAVEHDLPGALKLLAELPEAAWDNALTNVMGKLRELDPGKAADQVLAMAPGPLRQRLATNLIAPLISRDVIGTLDWIQKLKLTPDERQSVLLNINYQTFDRKTAVEWFKANPPASGEDRILGLLVRDWSRDDPDAALAWSGALSNNPLNESLKQSVINGLASIAPERAAAVVAAWPSGPARDNASRALTQEWAASDPEAAATWASRIAGPARIAAFGDLAAVWGTRDPIQASSWIERLDSSPARDSAVAAFSRSILGHDPGKALTWANTIADGVTRQENLQALAGDWVKKDPQAARQWIAGAKDLAPSLKALLLNPSVP